jgi:hypothetical protein
LGLLLLLAFGGCDAMDIGCAEHPQEQPHKVSISQGAWGHVLLYEGDFQPGAGCPSGQISAVSRTVYVYQAVRDSLAIGIHNRGFYDQVSGVLVDSIRSDDDGFFQVSLPPGTYSFLVRVESQLYANEWGPNRVIQPATVSPGAVVNRLLRLDYDAAS